MLWLKILIVFGILVLVVFGTYSIHWLLNIQEWVDIYIRRTRPDLLAKRKKRTGKRAAVKEALKQYKVVAKAVSYRDKVIELLAKDKPHWAPVFIYILASSFLVLTILGFLVLTFLFNTLR